MNLALTPLAVANDAMEGVRRVYSGKEWQKVSHDCYLALLFFIAFFFPLANCAFALAAYYFSATWVFYRTSRFDLPLQWLSKHLGQKSVLLSRDSKG